MTRVMIVKEHTHQTLEASVEDVIETPIAVIRMKYVIITISNVNHVTGPSINVIMDGCASVIRGNASSSLQEATRHSTAAES